MVPYLYLNHLFEQRSLLLVPTGRVDNNYFIPFFAELFDALGSDANRVCLRVTTVEGDPDTSCILLKLVKSTSTERICAYHGYFPFTRLIIMRIPTQSSRLTVQKVCVSIVATLFKIDSLGDCCRFSGTLKTHKHDYICFAFFGFEGRSLGVKHRYKLGNDAFFHKLSFVEDCRAII